MPDDDQGRKAQGQRDGHTQDQRDGKQDQQPESRIVQQGCGFHTGLLIAAAAQISAGTLQHAKNGQYGKKRGGDGIPPDRDGQRFGNDFQLVFVPYFQPARPGQGPEKAEAERHGEQIAAKA